MSNLDFIGPKYKLVFSCLETRVDPNSFSLAKPEKNSLEIKITNSMEFGYCREWFQIESRRVRFFLFSHTQGKTINIASFINKIERRLRVPIRSVFGPTNRRNITWIKPSPFWVDTSMRRSLFTVLLRCGVFYNPEEDNFEQALFSNSYTSNSKYAVRRFLRGFTRYIGRTNGWFNQFGEDYKAKKEIASDANRLLQKPKK